jgi:hypothetical protein
MNPIIISCKEVDWIIVLKNNLKQGREADLTYFNADYDIQICEFLAWRYDMVMTADRENSSASFKKKNPN